MKTLSFVMLVLAVDLSGCSHSEKQSVSPSETPAPVHRTSDLQQAINELSNHVELAKAAEREHENYVLERSFKMGVMHGALAVATNPPEFALTNTPYTIADKAWLEANIVFKNAGIEYDTNAVESSEHSEERK